MKSFLFNIQDNDSVLDRAETVDLMRFLLSYMYDALVLSQTNLSQREPVESSVRNLLRELANESRVVQQPAFSSSIPTKFPERYGQTSMPLRQNIEMKRGDWICPKCSFMNFARNMKCLECDETRPKRQLTGGEWECPQCDFFNYGKNGVCLRCDCNRPTEASETASTRFGLEYNNETKANTWNTRTPSLEREMTSGQYQRTSPEGNYYQSIDGVVHGKSSGTAISQNLDKILGRTSEESKSGYVPFKPLPSDMFARSQKSEMEEQVTSNDYAAAEPKELMSSRNADRLPLSIKPVNHSESKEDKVQAEKSERWFKKVAELHDVTDLASAISDEDFPEIMPMRKGENRFVVSKKKDRSLTSPVQKRRMAMEQTNSSNNFVPFVPFPPDYFAKKDKVPETEASTGQDASDTSASATPEIQGLPENLAERKAGVLDSETFMNSIQSGENQQHSKEKCDTSYAGKFTESRVNHSYGRSTSKSAESFESLRPGGRESWSGGSWDDNKSSLLNPTGNSTRHSENADNKKESWKGGFSGKSLEGSLVQEPDPLDMSEEAKAQRWFKRASQIKDISELSQIPDEDFPQIMPMRKGVNRFVVSKRKTPLERRLTSPQYRRNLPIVSSDPIKKDNSES
ncbi:hypothetical protein AQUCO_00100744v1 [Aquilegia coerulea]|nr:hypothetical protein AQUCO_00100744v1 [Aquilegia coerulea]